MQFAQASSRVVSNQLSFNPAGWREAFVFMRSGFSIAISGLLVRGFFGRETINRKREIRAFGISKKTGNNRLRAIRKAFIYRFRQNRVLENA